ncbi:hypothetical protein BBJ29_000579 [Phytophthora kernoviae]|uniref:Uncharacterized protein n=1 Tax=Phytophthora kernoviae TaxID=325452 RepID=A0A3F2S1S3_9STRA|nr:hypothetical protein BBJ29_000579 [Phytophthora kernoviae]RLN68667.1 hypothetical protein BBP00_00000916 [Phytophthora kernoviae]
MVVNGNVGDAPTYFPNSMGGPKEIESLHYNTYDGEHAVVDKYSSGHDDNYTQLVSASKPVQERTLKNFNEVDPNYAQCVKDKMDQMVMAKAAMTKSKKRITAPLNPLRKAFAPVAP